MELKPTRDKTMIKVRLDGVGGRLAPNEYKNPWQSLARGLDSGGTGKRKRPFSDTLGATPPRDGPFAMGATDVAAVNPPRTRQKRNLDPGMVFPKRRG